MFVTTDKLDYSNIMFYNYRVYLYKKGGYPMKQIKKPLSILLSLILAFSVFSIFSFEVGADTASIQYIDRSWDEETKTVTETVKTLENPPVFEQDHYTGNVTVGDGWLFVDRNITIDQTMYISEGYHVNLIIANGCTLTVKGGIYVRENAAFSVYGQQGDTGKLYATNEYDENEVAPIDGDTGSARFNVYGATIEAISDNRGTAGIGRNTSSAYADNNFTITIWGGKVTAEGGNFRAGISGRITIYGGTVNATGGTFGAGIGGGSERGGGYITINGGEVTAIGGAEGAGIGGGNYGNSGNITINSGKVNAYGGCVGAGIGGGNYGGGVNITINGGEIIAQSTDINTEGIAVGEGAGIGGGYHGNGGNITINGGSVSVINCSDGAAGIGGGYRGSGGNITINGGVVEVWAAGCGIGCSDGYIGDEQSDITLNWTEASRETMSVRTDKYRGTVTLQNDFFGYSSDEIVLFSSTDIINNDDMQGITLKPPKMGDANYDGVIDVCDATAIQRHIADIEQLFNEALLLGDVNCDGIIDIADVTLVQMYIAGCDVSFGAETV